jgi:beta-glucosidase
LIGVLFAGACTHGARRFTASGSGGSGTGQGGSTGAGGSAIHTDLPEVILPPGGASPSVSKMSCPDDPSYTLAYSPGYSEAQHQANLTEARRLMSGMDRQAKAEQLRGVFAGTTEANWLDIQRSFNTLDNSVRGWQYRDGPRGLNIDQPIVPEGTNRGAPGEVKAQHGSSTVFPVPVARGATFDVGLEYRIGEAMGDEMIAANTTMLLVPCVNILRHPYWGRAQETYGEDTFHLGRIGTGLAAGIQTYSAACVKHFAANNIERNRSSINSELDAQTLREVYGRHFEMIAQDGGVACVMASYNRVNGTKATQNATLLKTILRGEFGYKGLVLSDWWAMPGGQPGAPATLDTSTRTANAHEALSAGLDIEVPWAFNYSVLDNTTEFPDNEIIPGVERVLEQKVRFKAHKTTGLPGLRAATTTYVNPNITNNDAHIAIAEETALKSIVLLKNCPTGSPACAQPAADSILPIKREGGPRSIAVVGATMSYCSGNDGPGITFCFQDYANMGTINFASGVRIGDTGSSRANYDPAKAVSPFAGICQAAGGTVGADGKTCSGPSGSISVTTGTTNGGDVTPAVDVARNADMVVVVVGLTPYDEGEEYNGNDRTTLSLDGKDYGPRNYGTIHTNLMNGVLALNKPTIVIVEAGSAVDLPWRDRVPAIVMAWYPGMVGGRALGKLLFGDANFSGKLPITWPLNEAQLPTFNEAEDGTTKMDYFLGYRRFDQMNLTPLYPFGHGLSYSTFQYGNLQVPCSDVSKNGVVELKVDVHNTSPRGGEEVVMAFVSFPPPPASNPSLRRSKKELKGFLRVGLDGMGQTTGCRYGDATTPCASSKQITIPVRVKDLKYYDMANSRWDIQSGQYKIVIAPNSAIANKALQSTPELCPAGGGVGCALSDTLTVN